LIPELITYLGELSISINELVDDRYEIGSHTALGKLVAIRTNRISFTFDLKGPSLVVDTGE